MLPGPVFYWELITTSRRLRYYLARSAFGSVLLLIIWSGYESTFAWRSTEITIRELSRFASECFEVFTVVQCLAVLALVPPLTAGVIADEKQRKTLHYLLASQLTSGEIVLGKATARYLHLAVIVTLGLPILSLLTLLGGVTPEVVLLLEAGTATTGFFLCALGVVVSTFSRRVRDAVLVTYFLEAFWLLVPLFRFGLWWWLPPSVQEGIDRVTDVVYRTNPFYVLQGSGGRGSDLLIQVGWMMLAHVVVGMALLTLAVLQLRPVYRSQMGGGGPRWRSWLRRPHALQLRRTRRPCGDNAMYWKEVVAPRRLDLVTILLILGVLFLGIYTIYQASSEIEDAVREFMVYGYSASGEHRARDQLNSIVRVATGLLFVAWGIFVGISASLAITSEREEDTWVSLVSTPLEGQEIVLNKLWGSYWRWRGLAYLILGIWIVGLVLGSIHPAGFLFGVLLFTVFSWFLGIAGVVISLNSSKSLLATVATIAILGFLNGGYLMCCVPMGGDDEVMLIGCSPVLLVMSCITPTEWGELIGMTSRRTYIHYESYFFSCLFGALGYGFLALILTLGAIGRFDDIVDRPRREIP